MRRVINIPAARAGYVLSSPYMLQVRCFLPGIVLDTGCGRYWRFVKRQARISDRRYAQSGVRFARIILRNSPESGIEDRELIDRCARAALLFSGGVDSTLLAYMLHKYAPSLLLATFPQNVIVNRRHAMLSRKSKYGIQS